MASSVSKLARAAFATRAFPLGPTRAFPLASGGIAGGGRPAAAISGSPAGGPKSEEGIASPATVRRDPHLAVDENALKSEGAMWAFYEYWCKYHGISRDRREMERRFKIFSRNARFVHEFNSAGVGTGEMSMTKFADLTKEEISCRIGQI